ncbi:MAG: CDGSH iron-sulfur domain-containing protein [Ignavibacteria bacterium]|nr:CDGSH iron-sulfur domain-containing protein [Ignavibacteria bacterium]
MATKLTIKSNGSIKVEGEFELFDDKGNTFDIAGRTRISLCRCGLSKTKPFCDSSHRDGNFQAESIAFALPPPAPKP